MMKLSRSHRKPQYLPLSPFLVLHRIRNPRPHRLTNPLRFPQRIPRRNPLRQLLRGLTRSPSC